MKHKNQHTKTNKSDARYQKSEHKIKTALNSLLGQRVITLKVKDICCSAHLKPPTFYRHYRNPNQAFTSLEDNLINEIRNFITNTPKDKLSPHKIFTFLFLFVYQNRSYFKAANRRDNHYLLDQIISYTYKNTYNSHRHVSALTLNAYYGAVIYSIVCWGKTTNFDLAKSPRFINYILDLPKILDL